MDIIKRGAEAILYKENGKLVKERIKKNYRLEEIDSVLRKGRTKKEAKLLSKAKRIGVSTPNVISVDEEGNKIIMDFIEGIRLKEFFNEACESDIKRIAEEVGKGVGKLHENNIIHGDLTTSNMILKDDEVFFIDFGLGESSPRIESHGTDLSVLREAFQSTHFNYLNVLWESFIKGYKQTNSNFNKVLDALDSIEKRGRYVKRNGRKNRTNKK